jgi:glycerophosphoryl diester phosphodiesterase
VTKTGSGHLAAQRVRPRRRRHLLPPTSLVRDAHHVGLLVTPYTFRNENSFLPADFRSDANPADYGNALAEDQLYYSLGVDGFFTDEPTPPCWPASCGSRPGAP